MEGELWLTGFKGGGGRAGGDIIYVSDLTLFSFWLMIFGGGGRGKSRGTRSAEMAGCSVFRKSKSLHGVTSVSVWWYVAVVICQSCMAHGTKLFAYLPYFV